MESPRLQLHMSEEAGSDGVGLPSRESSAVCSAVFSVNALLESASRHTFMTDPGHFHVEALPRPSSVPYSTEEPDPAGEASSNPTVCGYPIHLTLVRSYSAPADVTWKDHSFDTSVFGFVYNDRTVSDQFLVFYKRSFVTFFVGGIDFVGFLLCGVVPLLTRRFMEFWIGAAVVLLLCMIVDGWAHFFADLSPTVAKIRMGVSFVGCIVFVSAASWVMWSAQAHCDEAYRFPHYPGRKIFKDTADLLRHCRAFIEPMPIVAAASSLGLSLHPLAQLPLMAVFVFLNIFVGRWYADVHEPTSERLVKAASILIAAGGAAILTVLQFFACRAAFEATIRIEGQRQEAEVRVAELQHLLTTIVPSAVLPRLLAGQDQFSIDEVECASMLFADMKGFTAWSSSRTAVQVTSMLNTVVAAVDGLAASATGVEKIKTIGDAYWAVAGIPVPDEHHADHLILFAWHMNKTIATLNRRHAEWEGVTWRVAVHTGPMSGALFGERQVSYEVFGETARIAQVVEANGVSGALCVTQAVIDAMIHTPPSIVPQLRRSLEGELPHGHVLDIFELAPPSANVPIPDAQPSLEQSQSMRSVRSMSVLSIVVSGDGDSPSTPITSTVVSPKSNRGSRYLAGTPSTQRNVALPRLPSLTAIAHTNAGASQDVAKKGQVNEAAAADMATPKWRLLPWFNDEALEAVFKARCETVVRPNARAAAVLSCVAHALSIGAGFGEEERCYTTPSLILQSIAAVGFIGALAITLHPRGSLSIAELVSAVATAFSVIGLGIAALSDCHFAHDVLWLCLFLNTPHAFVVGPVSWPIFAAGVWVSSMAPGLTFSLLHSPTGPSNSVLSGVGAGVLSVCLAYVEETSLRRRFIEEELSKRCEQQLQTLSEERVVVLERLVPKHVINDLIAWFGTGMDPFRSIARNYNHVLIAFLQLRPAAVSDLAILHAEIDRDLDTVNRDIVASLGVDSSKRIVDKIKTVGDVVMLAGPFVEHRRARDQARSNQEPSSAECSIATLSTAATPEDVAATCSAVLSLARAVQPRCPLRLGAHVGPVVGTVQGSSRLAFDIFGDAVNVASRVMSSATAAPPAAVAAAAAAAAAAPSTSTTPAPAALRVSADLHNAILDSPAAPPVPFGKPVTVVAKGKGDLVVFPVLDAVEERNLEKRNDST